MVIHDPTSGATSLGHPVTRTPSTGAAESSRSGTCPVVPTHFTVFGGGSAPMTDRRGYACTQGTAWLTARSACVTVWAADFRIVPQSLLQRCELFVAVLLQCEKIPDGCHGNGVPQRWGWLSRCVGGCLGPAKPLMLLGDSPGAAVTKSSHRNGGGRGSVSRLGAIPFRATQWSKRQWLRSRN